MNDVGFLPTELKQKSLSSNEIVLEYEEALSVINLLVTKNMAMAGWEGWIRYPDGSHGHSQFYQGTTKIEPDTGEAWSDFVLRSADLCKQTMEFSQQKWNAEPEILNGKLYFCITVYNRISAELP